MTTTIALAGKGGVGKTTIAAMVIKYLAQTQTGPILAIDADPSSNLNMVLGLELDWTVGDIREDMLAQVKQTLAQGGAAMGTLAGGITKREHLDFQVRSALAEGARYDLIAMGRSEGPGCYCAVNHHLRDVVDGISKHYRYVVIDNEAGMEHLSRRTTRDVQILLVVSDPTQRGLVAAERIATFRHELDIHIERAYLILNNLAAEAIPTLLQARINAMDVPLLGVVPRCEALTEFETSGRPLIAVDDSAPAYMAVAAMLQEVM
ncbi:MAG: AAA family ATPase [Anaerolineae bacterium]|nr:AAA family ATPase [Anaerolineae bacterium]